MGYTKYPLKWVEKRRRQLLSIDIDDLLDMFKDILMLDSNIFYTKDLVKEIWNDYLCDLKNQ